MDAGLLALNPKGLVSTPITGCGHEMAPWSEVTVDHSMGRCVFCLSGAGARYVPVGYTSRTGASAS